MKKIIAFFLAAMCLACVFTACKPSEDTVETFPTAEVTVAPTTEPETEPETEPTDPPGDYNILTGLYDLEKGSVTRPVGFMIGNNPPSRPQYGIDKADLYIEAETEGGITRIMAVFSSADKLPSQIGPMRSGRTPFINLANALDAIYVHCGASIEGFKLLDSTGIAEIDAIYSSAFWRDEYLKEAKGYEYSLMTGKDEIYSSLTSGDFNNTVSNSAPFNFAEQEQGNTATSIQTDVSYYETISFTYDASTNLYTKQLGSLDSAEKHLMADGTPITASNVIIIYDDQYWENSVTLGYPLYGGHGVLFTGGTAQDITWSRDTKQLTFYDSNGDKLSVNPGKTYIVLEDSDHEENTFYN